MALTYLFSRRLSAAKAAFCKTKNGCFLIGEKVMPQSCPKADSAENTINLRSELSQIHTFIRYGRAAEWQPARIIYRKSHILQGKHLTIKINLHNDKKAADISASIYPLCFYEAQSPLFQYSQKVGKSFKVDIGAAIADRSAYRRGFEPAGDARIYSCFGVLHHKAILGRKTDKFGGL